MIIQFFAPALFGFIAGHVALYLTFMYTMKDGVWGIVFGKGGFVPLGGSVHWSTFYSAFLIPIIFIMLSVYALRVLARTASIELTAVSYVVLGVAFVLGFLSIFAFKI